MKYKLIKTYPDSPELGEIHCSENKTETWKGIWYYNKYPEYWEKVEENVWWCVWKEDFVYFKAWKPYKIECTPAVWETERHYFKTEEQAAKFVIYNKPCLSITEIGSNIPEGTLFRLIGTAKSKL